MTVSAMTERQLKVAMGSNAGGQEIVDLLNTESSLNSTEVGYLDGTVAGTAAAGKCVVLTTNKVIDTIDITTPKIGGTAVAATAAELNNRDHLQPALATISAAAGATNVCEVTVTIKDGTGTAVTGPVVFDLLLSDSATGAGLTATTASGAVAAKASSGTDLSTLVSKKALKVQSKADGTYILSITDSSKTGFYPVVQIPGLKAIVGSQLVTGNYG